MERPRLLPTATLDETVAGVTYHLEGELVPSLTIELPPQAPVYFEHHVLLWKHPGVQIRIKPMAHLIHQPQRASRQGCIQ